MDALRTTETQKKGRRHKESWGGF